MEKVVMKGKRLVVDGELREVLVCDEAVGAKGHARYHQTSAGDVEIRADEIAYRRRCHPLLPQEEY